MSTSKPLANTTGICFAFFFCPPFPHKKTISYLLLHSDLNNPTGKTGRCYIHWSVKIVGLREVKGPVQGPTEGQTPDFLADRPGVLSHRDPPVGTPIPPWTRQMKSQQQRQDAWEGGQNPSFPSGCSKELSDGSGRLRHRALPTLTETGN